MSLPESRATEPKRLVVCADDYALTPGVSRAIRELIATRRISATSVMTVSEFWPEEAAALKAVAGDADIGLHVTLTDQAPLGGMPTLAPDGTLPPLGRVYRDGALRRLPLDEIEAELVRQIEAFVAHWGGPPAHIDGHHHVHQLPGVRDLVVRAAARLGGGRTWVRCCDEARGRIVGRGIAMAKALTIGAFGAGVRNLARAARVPTNDGFSGVYDFAAETRPLPMLFDRFLSGARENALVMCHPGHSDDVLAARDVMTEARDEEAAFLASDAWPQLVSRHEFEIGPLRR
ncbi:MAG: ChbG/HpnK family deacetylase [Proteobacteria bacterium]|nr:ChbG/HpnK family deacetylase [Pseudomonadota bacterium]